VRKPGGVVAGDWRLEMGRFVVTRRFVPPLTDETGGPTYWKEVSINNCSRKTLSRANLL
jgi:hypothetical protein